LRASLWGAATPPRYVLKRGEKQFYGQNVGKNRSVAHSASRAVGFSNAKGPPPAFASRGQTVLLALSVTYLTTLSRLPPYVVFPVTLNTRRKPPMQPGQVMTGEELQSAARNATEGRTQRRGGRTARRLA
jgi:hypothetical protein